MSLFTEKLELSLEEAQFNIQKSINQFSPIFKWGSLAFCILLIPGYFATKYISYTIWNSHFKSSVISAKRSFTNAKKPSIGLVSLTKAGEENYTAIAEISNENVDLAADNISYDFVFTNSSGENVKTISGVTYLLPSKKKFLIIPRITTKEKITSATVKLAENITWQKKLKIPNILLITNNPQTYNQTDPVALVVEGYFQNISAYALNKVTLSILLYDKSGKILGASQRAESTIKPFGRRAYKQLWPGIYTNDVVKTVVFAETNPLDSQNFTLEEMEKQNSSSLERPQTQQR